MEILFFQIVFCLCTGSSLIIHQINHQFTSNDLIFEAQTPYAFFLLGRFPLRTHFRTEYRDKSGKIKQLKSYPTLTTPFFYYKGDQNGYFRLHAEVEDYDPALDVITGGYGSLPKECANRGTTYLLNYPPGVHFGHQSGDFTTTNCIIGASTEPMNFSLEIENPVLQGTTGCLVDENHSECITRNKTSSGITTAAAFAKFPAESGSNITSHYMSFEIRTDKKDPIPPNIRIFDWADFPGSNTFIIIYSSILAAGVVVLVILIILLFGCYYDWCHLGDCCGVFRPKLIPDDIDNVYLSYNSTTQENPIDIDVQPKIATIYT